MHLFFFLKQRNPGISFRMTIAAAQGVFFNAFFFGYMISPSLCHRFVGYLEEEAVHTYTVLLDCLDKGKLEKWAETKAPREAAEYYNLPEGSMMRDLIVAVRADEICHREVNHHFADLPAYAEVDHLHVHINDKNRVVIEKIDPDERR